MVGTDSRSLQDPVCGMTVTDRSPQMTVHEGISVYFCGAGCKAKFLADPAKYPLSTKSADQPSTTAMKPAALGTIYTCPMHPQIHQVGPGSCPICGMSLEPKMPTLEGDENPELIDFRRRFFWTLPLTLIVVVFAMAGHRVQWLNSAMESWTELALSLPIVLWAGKPFLVRAVQSLIHRSPNMWTLIGLGNSAAFLYSVGHM